MDDLIKLINSLPTLIMYIVPAIAFFFTYRLLSHTNKKFENISTSTIVLSFVLTTFIKQVFKCISYPISDVTIIVISALLGLLCGTFVSSPWIDKNIVGKLFHRTIDDNVWYGISDEEHGCRLEVFMNDKITSFYGTFFKHFTDDKGTWIVLTNYSVKINNILDSEQSKDSDSDFQIVINTENIDHVVIQYHPDSQKKNT